MYLRLLEAAAARQIENVAMRGLLEKGSEVEAPACADPAPLQGWSEVNLDFALWFILGLFVSFF